MERPRTKTSERSSAHRIDRAARNLRAGAAIGAVLGSLFGMLLSKWISEEFFWLIVTLSAAIGTVAFGLIWPADMGYYDFEADADNIEPAERVELLRARRGDSR